MVRLTIELDDRTQGLLSELSMRQQMTPEQAVADLVRRRLLSDRFRELCASSEALARAAGYTSEDEILRDLS